MQKIDTFFHGLMSMPGESRWLIGGSPETRPAKIGNLMFCFSPANSRFGFIKYSQKDHVTNGEIVEEAGMQDEE